MPEQNDPKLPDSFDPNGDVPVEEDPLEVEEAPRRAASAEFIVSSGVGSEAALREAMDPANQSLADALRLSYRILTIIMIVLFGLFLLSGFQTVEESQAGVRIKFGEIVVDETGQAALDPGIHLSLLPYPAGEFILFNQSQTIQLNNEFFPNIPPGTTTQVAIESTNTPNRLMPGLDGSVLTSDDGIAHLQLTVTYEIIDPVQFLTAMRIEQAARFVRLAIQRAAVLVAAESTVDRMLSEQEILGGEIARQAQSLLTEIDSGIQLRSVQATDVKPPFFVVRTFNDLQNAINEASTRRSQGVQRRDTELNRTAGPGSRELLRLIAEYEASVEAANIDPSRSSEMQAALARVDAFLVNEQVAGDVAKSINAARSYRTQIESRLRTDVERFKGLLPTYRNNPSLVVQKLVADSYRRVLSNPDVEQFIVPTDAKSYLLRVVSLQEVMIERRKRRQELAQQRAAQEAGVGDRLFLHGFDEQTHQLCISDDGDVIGRDSN